MTEQQNQNHSLNHCLSPPQDNLPTTIQVMLQAIQLISIQQPPLPIALFQQSPATTSHQQQINQNGFLISQLHHAQQLSLNTHPSSNHHNRLYKRYYKLVPKMKIGRTSQSCTICMCKYQHHEVINRLPCTHIIHARCCKEWFMVEHKCPVCRMDLRRYYGDSLRTV